jgi:hypothetical protein
LFIEDAVRLIAQTDTSETIIASGKQGRIETFGVSFHHKKREKHMIVVLYDSLSFVC